MAVIDSAAPTGATEMEEFYIRSFFSHVARWMMAMVGTELLVHAKAQGKEKLV